MEETLLKAQYERWRKIDQIIRDGMKVESLVSAVTLSRRLGCSKRTVLRDIKTFKEDMDVPIEYDAKRKGYYYIQPDFRLQAVRVEANELFAVMLARKVLEQYRGTPVYTQLEEVFNKLQTLLPGDVAFPLQWLQESLTIIGDPVAEVEPAAWETVFSAIRNCRTISFMFHAATDSTGKGELRKLDPYHVVCLQGNWYVVGMCHRKSAMRTFAMWRMKNVNAIPGRTFAREKGFNLKSYLKNPFGIFRGSNEVYTVKLKFSPDQAPYVRERSWQEGQKVEVEEDGSLILSLRAGHLLEVKRWVLSWGSGVEVLEPEALKAEIRDDLEKTLSRYAAAAAVP